MELQKYLKAGERALLFNETEFPDLLNVSQMMLKNK